MIFDFFFLLKQIVRGHLTFKVALHFGKYGSLQKNQLKLIKAAGSLLLKSIFSV